MTKLELMESRLSEHDKARLKRIYEPTVVDIQPDNARRGLCVMPNGQLRSYGITDDRLSEDSGRLIYHYSDNCGLDWNRYEYPAGVATVINYAMLSDGKIVMGASVEAPWSKRYVTLVAIHGGERKGTWAMLSDIGPGDESPKMVKITDEVFWDIFQPLMLPDKKRMITTGSINRGGCYGPTVFYSDDNGESWNIVKINPTPKHEPIYPHLGTRWQNNGSEPNLEVIPDGRLMLLARTSLDYFYIYFSTDSGETWTDGEPSDFHATLTTPFMLTLHDGRTLLFWNNTRPLAEPNHELTWPPVRDGVKNGWGEDAFTNRDANHVAITEDGVNWIGFRELYLNTSRNLPDMHVLSKGDNSVHQFQAIELPYGKILVAFGQNELSRRTVIFDINWIYEKKRSENFHNGLTGVTTHLFVKSISDSWRDYPGHCAWNRTNGALLMPDPTGNHHEALQLCRIHDKRLVSELQGVVWNFPKAYSGILKFDMYLAGEGLNVRLCDHWINAGDPDAGLWALYDFRLDKNVLPVGEWRTVSIAFDTSSGFAEVFIGDRKAFGVMLKNHPSNGISYLHLQTAAEFEDFDGSYITNLCFENQ